MTVEIIFKTKLNDELKNLIMNEFIRIQSLEYFLPLKILVYSLSTSLFLEKTIEFEGEIPSNMYSSNSTPAAVYSLQNNNLLH